MASKLVSQIALIRASQPVRLQLRSLTARSPPLQQRLASQQRPTVNLTGAADNAFNRERAAVKAHAAATSGTTPNLVTCDAFFQLLTMADLWRKLAI